ncbi:hypothetical protein ABZ863_17570 [Saccharomonospora sp. NPDC046836]|uniref:hypothetical protein n=1 Tax=Saccharomonospora sp. NPDC046836 TaxID=3156921 RepID=UPI0033C196EF
MNIRSGVSRTVEGNTAIAAAVALGVAAVTYLLGVLNPWGQALEAGLVGSLHALPAISAVVRVAAIVVPLGLIVVAVLAVALPLANSRDWRAVWVVGFSAFSAFAVAAVILLAAPRPAFTGDLAWGTGTSFPSPLLAASVGLAVATPQVVAPAARAGAHQFAAWGPALVAVLLCAGLWNRPSDVVGGAAIGVAAALVVCVTNGSYLRRLATPAVDLRRSWLVRGWALAAAALLATAAVGALVALVAGAAARELSAALAVAGSAGLAGLFTVAGGLIVRNALARADLLRGTETPTDHAPARRVAERES